MAAVVLGLAIWAPAGRAMAQPAGPNPLAIPGDPFAAQPPPPPPPAPGVPPAPTAEPAAAPQAGSSNARPLLEKVVPGNNPGPQPSSHYDLGYDEGGRFSFATKVMGFFMSGAFDAVRWIVRPSLWITEWPYEFGFIAKMGHAGERLGQVYEGRIVRRLHLDYLFLVLAAGWCCWQVGRGRVGRGLGEFAVSSVVAALAVTLLARPATMLFGAHDQAAELASDVAAVTLAQDGAADKPQAVVRPLTSGIHRSLVERPHELINWGRQIPAGDPCRRLYDELVAAGPHGSDDAPRLRMKDECRAGGKEMDEFNRTPTFDRFISSVMVAVAALIVCWLAVRLAIGLVLAQLILVFAVAVAPFALRLGILPSGGRTWLWRWATMVLKALVTVALTTVLLALFLVGVEGSMTATAGQPLLVQMLAVVVVSLGGYLGLKRLMRSGQQAAARVGERMGKARVGSGEKSSWLGASAAGAGIGYAASQWREERAEARQATKPLRKAGERYRHTRLNQKVEDGRQGPGAGERGPLRRHARKAGQLAEAAASALPGGTAVAAGVKGGAMAAAGAKRAVARAGHAAADQTVRTRPRSYEEGDGASEWARQRSQEMRARLDQARRQGGGEGRWQR